MIRRQPSTRGGGRSGCVRKLRSHSRLWSHTRCSDRGGRQGARGKEEGWERTTRLPRAVFGRVGENHTPTGRLRTMGLSGTSRAPLARFTTERGRGWERSVRKPYTHATGLSVSLGQTMRSGGCLGERRRLLARSALRQDGDVVISHAHSGSQDTAPSQQRPKVVANRQVFALVFRTHMTAAHSAAFIRATFGTLKRSHPTVFSAASLFSRA